MSCTGGEVAQVTLSWQVERAAGVTLSIDGPGKYDDYPATATVEVPFACGEPQHTYTITSIGGSGPAASQTKTITRA